MRLRTRPTSIMSLGTALTLMEEGERQLMHQRSSRIALETFLNLDPAQTIASVFDSPQLNAVCLTDPVPFRHTLHLRAIVCTIPLAQRLG